MYFAYSFLKITKRNEPGFTGNCFLISLPKKVAILRAKNALEINRKQIQMWGMENRRGYMWGDAMDA